jgi:hypothetical protein
MAAVRLGTPPGMAGTERDPLHDNTTTQGGAAPSSSEDARQGVRGGDADRMDPGPLGGVPTGADGDTAAREQLRKDLGERPADAGTEG